ncbi:low molecular weight protein-tyrosine-phosphatase [Luteimonas terrae]|uniref:protein-tyrosine-phosphatase n=1 Tax=Luteimonas terrae TaxID=1530191 RepID=A0ABU1XV79_9GAMM|nr:low molecular weight protein-tyrosine-phosphatase [Luteimonas terrae]MDR7192669.1 protein-tyrosine phosphatase [Luteimonas terrae]
MSRLLVVCLGNICRSPMAEGALRARIEGAGLRDVIEVDSCGTGDWHVGDPPDPRAIRNAAGHGVDISSLRARMLDAADYRDFDVLLCADASTLRIVRDRRPPDGTGEIALLLDWAGQGGGDVPDPYTGDAAGFESVWQLVDAAAREIVARYRRGAPGVRA